jgi:hypothetical protein
MTNAEYHSHPAVSKSHLDEVARSPRHYWHRFLDPQREASEPTPAMLLGSATHTRILEPHLYAAEYIVAPAVDRRTKAGKEAWEQFQAAANGKAVLTTEQDAQIEAMARAVQDHPAAALVLSQPGVCEASYFWTDEATGEQCKVRPDWHSECRRLIVDLKTTDDASPAGFQRSIFKWRYHVQSHWYLRGLGAEQFVFIAVERLPPHLVGVYVATPEMVAAGGRVADRDLARLAECRAADEWPGYSDEIVPIDLPRWSDD